MQKEKITSLIKKRALEITSGQKEVGSKTKGCTEKRAGKT